MESFTSIENIICCVLEDARACFAQRGFDYVNDKNHGRVQDEKYWEMLQLNAYIKALQRYEKEAHRRCRRPKLINPGGNSICLNPQINSLPLGIEKVDCNHCLTEIEVLKMVEVIKIFCSDCSCN